ncbi:MAG: AsmA-like C-terminal domain-containing protein [Trichlorobacter sp.]|nr:AsmA-like C-terminal domain-containing protein [Trichlorobacter sp.]
MRLKPPKLLVLFLILLLIAFAALNLALPRLLNLNNYKAHITSLLSQNLNRQVVLGDCQLSWKPGPIFSFSNLLIAEQLTDDKSDKKDKPFISAEKVSFRLALLPLLRKQIAIAEIKIQQPEISISRYKNGNLSIADLLESTDGKPAIRLYDLEIVDGKLSWYDQATQDGQPFIADFTAIRLAADSLQPGRKSNISLHTSLVEKNSNPGTISIKGSLQMPEQDQNLLASNLDATLQLHNLDYAHFWHYFADHIPFAPPGGLCDLKLTVKGSWQDFYSKVNLTFKNAHLRWPAVFPETVAPQKAELVFNARRTPEQLDFKSINLDLDNFSFKGSLKLSDLTSPDPLLTARGETGFFDYRKTRSYIPFGIIEEDVADFISNKIRAGRFKLVKGTLDARFSQLVNFEGEDNASTLFIHGLAENAVVSYGNNVPEFNRINTTLELKGSNFNLPDGRGYFGDSPFQMVGSIAEYATEGIPCSYFFTMDTVPKPGEVAWLAHYVGLDELVFNGPSKLQLNGNGLIRAYQLSGNWNLTSANYTLPSVIDKPARLHNSLNFSAVLSNDETSFTSINYKLPPMQLSAQGLFKHPDEGAPHLSFELKSNRFNISPQLPILTDLQKFQPIGMAEADLYGDGNPEDFKTMQYNGKIKLTDFSIRPIKHLEPLQSMNGKIIFNGQSAQTTDFNLQYGNTKLTIRGEVENLAAPQAQLVVKSPLLNLQDFGLIADNLPPVHNFSTRLSLNDHSFKIRSLKANLEKTEVSARGRYSSKPIPSLYLNINAPMVDIEELLPILSATRTANTKNSDDVKPSELLVTGRLRAANGCYHNFRFSNFSVNLKRNGNKLNLDNLEAELFDGMLHADGQLTLNPGSASDWSLQTQLLQARTDDFFNALEIDREISGRLNLNSNLSTKGNSFDEMRRNLQGKLDIKMERGTLKQFNALSKAFSILNLSQLLSFELPDMVHDGMPFNKITATYNLENGVLSTKNFFVDSNAMHISMVGDVDLHQEKLDLLIGIQPLQTVDKIISRIPIIGWILTGGDNNLISAYFEAKGSWSDPKVSTITAKSIAQGTLGIFQRVFELPVRIFTDISEVFTGIKEEKTEETENDKPDDKPD